jgi:hypothetical protein
MNQPIAGSLWYLRQLALVLSLAGLVILGFLLIPTEERATMRSPATLAQTKTGIPPLDANAPAHTKTATFAMG